MDECVPDEGLTIYHVKYRNSLNPEMKECTTVDLQEKELSLMDHLTGRRLLKLPYKNITSMYSQGESLGFQCGKDLQEVVLTTSFSNFIFAYVTKRKFGDQEVKIRQSWGMENHAASDLVPISEIKATDKTELITEGKDLEDPYLPMEAANAKKDHGYTNFDPTQHPLDQDMESVPSDCHYMVPSKAPHTVLNVEEKTSGNNGKTSSPPPNLHFSVTVHENTFKGSSVNGECTLMLSDDRLLFSNADNEEWMYTYIKDHHLSGQTIEFTCYDRLPMGAGKIIFDSVNASKIDKTLLQFRDTFHVVMSKEDDIEGHLGLDGEYKLTVNYDFLKLFSLDDTLCHYWQYKNMRSYGRNATSFSITCGRRSRTGEGKITFMTSRGNEIFGKVVGNMKDHEKKFTKQ